MLIYMLLYTYVDLKWNTRIVQPYTNANLHALFLERCTAIPDRGTL